ncbi:putative diguanylate cyclase YcdT [Methyloligella halotolerans]|uniref:diguanylate cyclase n=1 Tax=Methyloligella halotolerans TaxID=1177755 RepID=A0A1E2RV90_9HYPH|nr:GGDEF domain-containing protein [Methyloligella halotolerans]ODA66030.1 putative diguanylate cyclase YcdT [Methyloligella halotolerans]
MAISIVLCGSDLVRGMRPHRLRRSATSLSAYSCNPGRTGGCRQWLVILGFWLFWLGLRRFYDVTSGWTLAISATVLCVLLTVALYESAEARALIYAIGQSIPMVLSIAFLLQRSSRAAGAIMSCIGIGIGLAGHSVVVAMNVALAVGQPPVIAMAAIVSISMLSVIFSGVLWNFGFAVMTIERLRDEVSALAHIDPLTGLWNRRKFDEQLTFENARSARNGRPYALLLMDLDHFKSVNDRLGHRGGDASLVHFARVAKSCLRKTDVLARLGGDEFCVLMAETSDSEAHA